MQVSPLTLRKSVNKAYLRVKPDRSQIGNFKKIYSESVFLKNTWYSPNHYINTKGRSDLVIHIGKDTSTPVGVLFEAKKPGNRSEMPTADNLESKAIDITASKNCYF